MIDAGSQSFFVRALRAALYRISRLLFRIEYHGVERIPDGPLILAANHQSYLDPILISIPIRRQIRYMAWDRLFRVPLLGRAIRYFGSFPVRLASADKSAIRDALGALRRGAIVMIFPEGQRSPDGKLMPFLAGFARLALLARVPVVAVTVRGADRVWPPSRPIPLPGKIVVIFHETLHPHEWEIEEKSRRATRLQGEVFKKIQEGLKVTNDE